MTSWDLVFPTKSFCFPCKEYLISAKNMNGGLVLPRVVLREGESQQQLLRRFRKVVTRSSVLSEVRKRRWFISKNEQRRIAEKKAIRRQRKRARNNYK
jgi:small subunit ribosomal protein S21